MWILEIKSADWPLMAIRNVPCQGGLPDLPGSQQGNHRVPAKQLQDASPVGSSFDHYGERTMKFDYLAINLHGDAD